MDYKHALKLFENGKADSVCDYFKNNNYKLEYGYCLILANRLDEARKILSCLTSPRAEWACIIISILNDEYTIFPSYFEIRNFLELDITLFFTYHKIDFVQKLINNSRKFQEINNETYKFIARALLKNGYLRESKVFLDKSAASYYNDIELHYLYSEFYLAHNDKKNSLKALKTCLKINPQYYPAIRMTEQLEQNAI